MIGVQWTRNNQEIVVKLPTDTSLPFFAYGLFKPGQLCYSRIREFVQEAHRVAVNGILKERDGLPLLIKSSNREVRGFLIYFRSGTAIDAYTRINGVEPKEVYKWGEIQTNEENVANTLYGRRDTRGSADLEDVSEWDGRDDPYFKQALEEVEEILRNNQNFALDFKALFRLQMAYSLLWSAIERFTGLKYHLGGKASEKVYQIVNEKCFPDSLKRVVTDEREIFNTVDLGKCTLNPSDPDRSIRYYYQVRSNSIHRGKAVRRDFNTIKKSLSELLEIFKDVVNHAFKK